MGSDSVGMVAAWYGVLAILLLLVLLALWRSGLLDRLLRLVEEMVFSNWQLALLGGAAIALSLASGYTTFDGLRNFTRSPLLSALVAFGIQGVMLIVAWLIGETFATGMSRTTPGKGFSAGETAVGIGLGAALAGLVLTWALFQYDAVNFTRSGSNAAGLRVDWQRFSEVALSFATALVLLAFIVLGFRRGGDIAQSYMQSVRLIARNAVLWVMLLASMGASVFFSFDSHFNGIFPAEARARAAEIRTLNQVAGVVADIGERARKVQVAETERLFEIDGWNAYEVQLAKLVLAARASQAEIEAYVARDVEERQRSIGEQQERIAGAQRSQTALLRKRDELEAELQRIEPSMGALEAELAKAEASYEATRRAIAAKHIDASAEDGGVEGTLKPGKGPAWRRRMGELDELQRRLAIVEGPRVKDAQHRRDTSSARIVSLKREIATVVGEIAKYKAQIATAEHRIKGVQTEAGAAWGGRMDPGRALADLESARTAFHRQPGAEKLAALQALCGTLLRAVAATPAARQVRGIDCDPRSAAEAAARVFALNDGLIAFQERCAGGAKLPQSANTDALLSFGRQCLQDSGLVSDEAADIGARLQAIEMNRDDKAHRFVVTWNAFLDGNRLAYLALTLAVGIDALVFAAGLFGAAAARSPLLDLAGPKARSAEQLEAIVKGALGKDLLESAELVLAAMKPMGGDAAGRAAVELAAYDAETAHRIRRVLVAGAGIGAVERAPSDPHDERYLVRAELVEYLSVVANAARTTGGGHANRPRLLQIVGVALEPDRQSNAEVVLRHLEPVDCRHGFMARVDLKVVPEYDRRLVQNVLNAGMTASAVQRSRGGAPGVGLLARTVRHPASAETTFLIRADLFEVLLLYRAGAATASAAVGGGLYETRPARPGVADAPRRHRLLSKGWSRGAGNGGERDGSNLALADRIRYELVVAMGLTPAAIDGIWTSERAEAALAAAAVLKRHARSHPALREHLREAESDLRHALEREQAAISAMLGGEIAATATLNEQTAEIDRRIPALLLVREAGLVEKLILALEEAHSEGRLRDDEHALLNRLRELSSKPPSDAVLVAADLEPMQPRALPDRQSASRQLQHLSEPAEASTDPAENGTDRRDASS